MGNITIAEIGAGLGILVTILGALAFLLKPWRELKSDVKRLKYAVFGQDLKENQLATKEDMNKLADSINKLSEATNLLYRATCATIDALPEPERSKIHKEHLDGSNKIV